MKTLRILILEDHEPDAELEVMQLQRAGYTCQWERVQERDEFLARLRAPEYDLIFSDHNLPAFDGFAALKLYRSTGLDVPVIVISGTIGEETAIESLKAGATDYVMKDRLERLPFVVERALRERDEHRQRQHAEAALRESEARFRRLLQANIIGIIIGDADGSIAEANDVLLDMLGYTGADLPLRWDAITPPEWRPVDERSLGELERTGVATPWEKEFIRKDGTRVPVLIGVALLAASREQVVGFVLDLTKPKRVEAQKTALLEAAKDIAGTLDVDQLIECVQRRTAELLPCDAVLTFVVEPQTDRVRLRSAHGLPPEIIAEVGALRFPGDQPFAGRVRHGETVVVNDMQTQSWLPVELGTRLGVTALLAAPLRPRGHYSGTLVACKLHGGPPFEPHQVELFEGIARQLTVAKEAADLHQAQQEEAEVSRALARIGQELISVPGTPGLLDTLCRLMTEVLCCDCSYTLLWQPDACVYVPEAGYGDSPEQWEALRVLRLPRDALEDLLGVLAEHEVAQVDATSAPTPWGALPLYYGITRVLYVPLRSHGETIGVQVAGVRGPRAPFTATQERIARGAAHLASLALQTARLVEDLERANRLKSDFVATMSHELRTPLNVIMGYNEVLRDSGFGPLTAEQADALKRMDHSAGQLLELITATLDMSRLEAGRLPIELTHFDVADLMHEVRDETRELQAQSGLAFVWTVPCGVGRLRSDRVKLKVIVKNLLNNAVKFTPEGSVTIAVRPHEAAVEITVADTGIGIAPETVPIIFDPFRQGDSSSTRRYGGVGLGLHIVRRLVELLGGTVSVTSKVGQGSTFGLWVPRSINVGADSDATR